VLKEKDDALLPQWERFAYESRVRHATAVQGSSTA
jgi:hypothetical protein